MVYEFAGSFFFFKNDEAFCEYVFVNIVLCDGGDVQF